jgi:hypothetical protein
MGPSFIKDGVNLNMGKSTEGLIKWYRSFIMIGRKLKCNYED